MKVFRACLMVLLVAGAALAESDDRVVCTDDMTCVDMTGDPEATCSTELAFAPNTQWKTFACKIAEGPVTAFIDPESLVMSCGTGAGMSNATNATDAEEGSAGRKLLERYLLEDAAAEGPYCEITLGVTLGAKTLIMCTATECDLPAGEAKVTCKKTSCKCNVEGCGSPLVGGIVEGVKDEAGVECDAASGKCKISLKGLPVESIEATCTASECLTPEE